MKFTITGEPVAQGRPRFTTANGFPRAYDPAKSSDWKNYAKMVAASRMAGKPLMDGPLSLSVCVYRSIPSSWSKKKTAEAIEGRLRPITKPDLDNYVKCAKDALSGIVWKDDSQVVAFHEPFGKFYSETPRVEIEIKEL
ncbi:MAG TPA: RusA family crossover junction endodeoxyribonuclease [Sphaerochaeta sp.]|nr:RusA family crossover junction endodeoxyribonuclease [Sphaerochaeta sp.]